MNFHVITLFPESLDSYVNSSIVGRALSDGKIKIKYYNPRDYTKDKWRRVDQKPYAGGPGMVLEAVSVSKAVLKAAANSKLKIQNSKLQTSKNLKSLNLKSSILIVWFTPSGAQFTNEVADKAAKKYTDIVFICGRYEGIDARVKKIVRDELKSKGLKFDLKEISVGPYVLTGGELPAMIMIDTISRRIPGVLGKIESLEELRVASSDVYTRPEVIEIKSKKYKVPKVLLSGNHAKITEWRSQKNKKFLS
jgi:tRNA (guanine37-N1)-methyltransferase